MTIDQERLSRRLREEFDGTDAQCRVVVRQAIDLADSGQYRDDTGTELTAEVVVDELADAREGDPPSRWNWWMGALSIAYGGYEQFGIRRYRV